MAPENMYFAPNSEEWRSRAQGAGSAQRGSRVGSPVAFKLSPIADWYPHRTIGIIIITYPN